MKRLFLLLSFALFLSAAGPIASASAEIPLIHRHHKDAAAKPAKTSAKPKAKRTILHRAKPSREQAAHDEATYGMTGPKSVGWRHQMPGPAGAGAR